MKFLFVHGVAQNTAGDDIVKILKKLGFEASIYPEQQSLMGLLDDDNIDKLVKNIQEQKVDFLISIYFIMNVALAAYKTNIRYISILWDAPELGCYNPLGKIDNVWISTFDQLDRERFLKYGIKHVCYQPLSVDEENIVKWNREIQATLNGHYIHDISFIGSLYDTNKYDLNVAEIPVNMHNYFNSIFEEAAFQWDGVNRVYGKTSKEIMQYLQVLSAKLQMRNIQDVEDTWYFESIWLVRKIANIERVAVLNLLAEKYAVTIYTNSQSAKTQLKKVNIGPPVVYGKAAALVYAGSKINLNISLKGIERGTPQRIMDIMGAGGFVLSAYCPETAELFEEDKEIVMFRSPEELLEKVDYYLAHDKERREIARAGYNKVISCYTYEKKLKELLEWVEGEV